MITSDAIEASSSTLRSSTTAAAQSVLADPPSDGLTLTSLGSWAAERAAAEAQLSIDFNRESASETLAFLTDFAGLMGGAFVLLGRIESGESSA